MSPRAATLARLARRYREARALLELARLYQSRRMQRLRARELDRAWAALYAVAGSSKTAGAGWVRFVRPR